MPYKKIDKPSPYQTYFGTTLLFDSSQKHLRGEVSDYLQAIEEELQELDASMEQAIATMQERRRAAQAFRDAHAAIIPPQEPEALPSQTLTINSLPT